MKRPNPKFEACNEAGHPFYNKGCDGCLDKPECRKGEFIEEKGEEGLVQVLMPLELVRLMDKHVNRDQFVDRGEFVRFLIRNYRPGVQMPGVIPRERCRTDPLIKVDVTISNIIPDNVADNIIDRIHEESVNIVSNETDLLQVKRRR